eukprot:367749_1
MSTSLGCVICTKQKKKTFLWSKCNHPYCIHCVSKLIKQYFALNQIPKCTHKECNNFLTMEDGDRIKKVFPKKYHIKKPFNLKKHQRIELFIYGCTRAYIRNTPISTDITLCIYNYYFQYSANHSLINCFNCKSLGWLLINCDFCQGSGAITQECYCCQGTGTKSKSCTVCGGSGKIKHKEQCNKCYAQKDWSKPGMCFECWGGANDNGFRRKYKKCGHCRGNKQGCAYCNRTGRVYICMCVEGGCRSCKGSRTFRTKIKCVACDGEGYHRNVCWKCRGSKVVKEKKCLKCDERNKIKIVCGRCKGSKVVLALDFEKL